MDSNYILTNFLNISSISVALLIGDIMPVLTFVSILFALGWNVVKLINWLYDDEDGYKKFKNNFRKNKKL